MAQQLAPRSPWSLIIPDSLILSSGISRKVTVADLLTRANCAFRSLLEYWGFSLPSLADSPDRFSWHESSSGSFSMASAWEALRPRKNRIPWAHFIWNNAIAPRYKFNLWLITKNRLSTQALLISHGRIDYEVCAFCNYAPDSIDHLFFECHVPATLAFFWAGRCNLPWHN